MSVPLIAIAKAQRLTPSSMDGAEVSDRERADPANVRGQHLFATRLCMVPSQRARLRR